MEATRWAIEHPAETMAITVVVGAAAVAAVGLLGLALAFAVKRGRLRLQKRRRSASRKPEILFVGRWGDFGPELFRVGGKGVLRLSDPGGDLRPWPDDSAWDAVALARSILAEVMWQRPATRLARAFADAHLPPRPDDGFVLAAAEVEAWLADPNRDSEWSASDRRPR